MLSPTTRPLEGVDVYVPKLQVRVRFTDGSMDVLTFDQANHRLKVDGVPIIDWYARKN